MYSLHDFKNEMFNQEVHEILRTVIVFVNLCQKFYKHREDGLSRPKRVNVAYCYILNV
jgi:hypothetical protein